ncbi:PEP/pyruvate-binding domain-containing protein [Haloarchaeobius sp. DFWS5]|uniref:PEP/pyruvate-binding domain-containing protein n=1 Tax=Haloarchaeobius sp. DFWS5 TaxID=3446114 RepID=UPI003EB85072
MTVHTVVPFAESLAADPTLTGGKGANLAKLAAADLPVPAGFCVTTDVYRRLVDDPTVQKRIRALADVDPTDTEAVSRAGKRVRQAIRSKSLPDDVRHAITGELAILGIEDAYAVRSSSTTEDQPRSSAAGQQDTILNVVGPNAVAGTVVECMASLFSDRAIAYRFREDIPHGSVECAVVVQRMVYPQASGILFTADPVSGNRTVYAIDAGYGLGETQVGGLATADSVRADARTGEVLSYTVGEKRQAVHALPGGGTETKIVTSDHRDRKVLDDATVRRLVGLGNRIIELFETPMDVEWGLDDGRLVVLQARPVTTLFPVPEPTPADGELHVYHSWSHREAMPAAMPPLVVDLWVHLIGEVTESVGLADEFDVPAAAAGGRVYQNVTPLLRDHRLRKRYLDLMESVDEPAVDALRAFLTERDPWVQTRHRVVLPGRELQTTIGIAPVVTKLAAGAVPALLVGDPTDAAANQREWYDEYATAATARIREHETAAGRLDASLTELTDAVAVVFPRFFPFYATMLAGAALRALCPGHEEDIEALGRGLSADVVTDATLALGDLADLARSFPAVARAIESGADRETIAAVSEGGAAFDAALQAFLDEYGFRGPNEIDLSRPRWSEDPTPILGVVRGALRGTQPGAHRDHIAALVDAAETAATRLEIAAARTNVPSQVGFGGATGPGGWTGQARAAAVRRLVAVYRGYLPIREHPKYGIARVLAACRGAFLDAGRELADAGVVDDPRDVWFFRLDELRDALAGDTRAVPDIDARRNEFAHHARMHAPRVITSDGEILQPPATPTDGPILTGTPVSSGVVDGIARVVRDPTTETLDAGQILVVEYCDPGVTPLFLNATALVTEVGGVMTHGSLVAREYGLPAVVAVPDATSRIRTGDRIRVDGTNGTVEILE